MKYKYNTHHYCCKTLRVIITTLYFGSFSQLATSTAPIISPPLQKSYTFNPKTQSRLQIQCQASGTPTPVISWRKSNSYVNTSLLSANGVTITGNTLSISPATGSVDLPFATSVSGWYSCVAANRDGSAIADFSLSILVPPVIGHLPLNTDATYAGAQTNTASWMKIIMTCKANGIPLPTISWYEGSTAIFSNSSGYNISTLTDSGLSVLMRDVPRKSTTLVFKCKASNVAGETEKSAKSVISPAILPLLSNSQPSMVVTATAKSTVSIFCSLSSQYSQVVTWYYNKKVLPSSRVNTNRTHTKLTLSSVDVHSEGVYSCQSRVRISILSYQQSRSVVLSVPVQGSVNVVNLPYASIKVPAARRVILACTKTFSDATMSLNWRRSNGDSIASSPLIGITAKDLGYFSLLEIPGHKATSTKSDFFRCVGQQQSSILQLTQSAVVSVLQLESCGQNWIVNGEGSGTSGWNLSVPLSSTGKSSPLSGNTATTDPATGEMAECSFAYKRVDIKVINALFVNVVNFNF